MIHDVTVVIRSVGERTELACKAIVERQVESSNVFVIHQKPHSLAVRRTFEIGLENQKKWLLALDVDILLTEDAINNLISFASTLDKQYFTAQGAILDKLFCVPRNGGPHLYRTEALDQAIACMPSEGESLRAETAVLRAMAHKGYYFYNNTEIYGLHDYHQYYKDIYRKCFLQAHKHSGLSDYFYQIWSPRAQEDFDYQVALWGLSSGKTYAGKVRVDASFLNDEIEQVFSLKEVREKRPLEKDANSATFVAEEIANYQPSPLQKEVENRYYKVIDYREEMTKNVTKKPSGKVLTKAVQLLDKTSRFLKQYT